MITRLALIGCGGISHTHRSGFDMLADRLRVTATVDVDIERAREAQKVLGAEKAFTDFREALAHCDAVLIALPHHLHYPVGMACLEEGKHVLMEKPLANSERECLDLIEKAEEQQRTLMVAYCMRYHPLTLRLKELLTSKQYGDVFHLSIWTEQYTHAPEGHWSNKIATLGGGQLFSHGCHYIDLMLYFLGEPVWGVHVGTNFGTPWMEREGTSDVSIKFASGAVGYHGGTWGAKGTRLGYAFHAQCTEGMLEADFISGRLTLIQGKEETILLQTEENSKYMNREMEHFLDCITESRKPLTDGRDSLTGLQVIWRLYHAEDTNGNADLRGLRLQ